MFEPFVFFGVLGGRVVAALVGCGLEVVVTAAGTRACTTNKLMIFREDKTQIPGYVKRR